MEVNDIVYLVMPAVMHGYTLPNSAQIIKAKIIETLIDRISVEYELDKGRVVIQQIEEGKYYKSLPDAIRQMEPLISNKIKPIEEKDYTGEPMDFTKLDNKA